VTTHRYDLVTVGRANMDLYSQDIGAAFEDITGFDATVGGSPTNIAIGTARLGLRSVAFTGVGDDRVGDFVVRYLRDAGVETRYIPHKEGKLTSLALLGIRPPSDFPLSFYREDPADIHLTTDDFDAIPLADVRAVGISGNALSRGTCADTTVYVADRAKTAGLATFVDLDLRPTEWETPMAYGEAMSRVFPLVDVAIGTEEEFYAALMPDPASVLAGGAVPDAERNELDSRVVELLGQGIAAIALKRGPRGVSIVTRNERLNVPGFEVEVLNTVGAGDAFASGLIRSRLLGLDWWTSARFANACGAITVTRHGCASAFPTVEEVEAFVAAKGGW
jgi:5-dehydro-2-deoxygluconokinase